MLAFPPAQLTLVHGYSNILIAKTTIQLTTSVRTRSSHLQPVMQSHFSLSSNVSWADVAYRGSVQTQNRRMMVTRMVLRRNVVGHSRFSFSEQNLSTGKNTTRLQCILRRDARSHGLCCRGDISVFPLLLFAKSSMNLLPVARHIPVLMKRCLNPLRPLPVTGAIRKCKESRPWSPSCILRLTSVVVSLNIRSSCQSPLCESAWRRLLLIFLLHKSNLAALIVGCAVERVQCFQIGFAATWLGQFFLHLPARWNFAKSPFVLQVSKKFSWRCECRQLLKRMFFSTRSCAWNKTIAAWQPQQSACTFSCSAHSCHRRASFCVFNWARLDRDCDCTKIKRKSLVF